MERAACALAAALCLAAAMPASRAAGSQAAAVPAAPARTAPAVQGAEPAGTPSPAALPGEPAAGEDATPPPETAGEPADGGARWAPPEPAPDGFDWIQLSSGEWLKGEIQAMRHEKLEFESDELDDQTLDWRDVVELRSPRRLTYVLDDLSVMTGTAVLKDGRMAVDEEGALHPFPPSRLMSIVQGDKKNAWGFWSGKAGVGVSFQQGNTDQTLLAYQGFLRRQTALTRARLDANGSISVLNGEQNENKHMGLVKLDVFLSPRFYLTPASMEAVHDRFQNIGYRLTPSAGVGYKAIDSRKVKCDVELAGGYQYTRYVSVEPLQAPDAGNGTVIPSVRLETAPHPRVDLDGLYRAQITFPAVGDTNQHAEATLSLELTDLLDLDVTFMWDRLEEPVPEEDGVVPRKDDYKLTVGLALDF